MNLEPEPLLDYQPLRSGQVYRVLRSFVDADATEHPVGEEWTYLTYRCRDAVGLVTLYVRDAEGLRRTIPLASDPAHPDDVRLDLRATLSRVPELPEHHQFRCGCELGGADWAEVFGSNQLSVVQCFACGLVVAMQPVPGGSHLVSLDDEAREGARQVGALPGNTPFEGLLRAAINWRSFPANVMVGTLLSRRSQLEEEFSAAIRSELLPRRLAALEFISQMQHVPDSLAPAIVRALKSPLDTDPHGDEIRWALEALLVVADRVTEFRSEIAELRRTLRQFKTEEARRLRTVVQAILKKMDEHIRESNEKREAAIAVVRKLAADQAFGQAEEWLDQWVSEHPEGHQLIARADLAEAAGDGLTESQPEAARWLYQQALDMYRGYAATHTLGEAAARGRHVRRVGRKLGMPPSTLPPPPAHHATISSAALAPPSIPDGLDSIDAAPSPPRLRFDAAEPDAPEIEVTGEIPVEDFLYLSPPTAPRPRLPSMRPEVESSTPNDERTRPAAGPSSPPRPVRSQPPTAPSRRSKPPSKR